MNLAAKILFIFSLVSTSHSLACNNASTTSNRVVYIGDSHTVGDFGTRLGEKLTSKFGSTPVKRYGVVGAAANHWNKKDNSSLQKLKMSYYCDGDGKKNGAVPKNFPTVSQLFQGTAPRVVIALGTNDINLGCKIKDKNEQMAATRELLAQIRPGSKCDWVGPTTQPVDGPLGKNCGQVAINAYVDNLRDTVKTRCDFIDSRKIKYNGVVIKPNRKDKLHYEGALANHWADVVAEYIAGGSQAAPKQPAQSKPQKTSN